MKTYLKKYEVVDIKGYLEVNDEGEYFISYEESKDEVKVILLKDIVEQMVGNAVQFKTITK